ncbi:MAG: M50 family metallopeptidase [Alphaproteobacteria bacterium]|nr:M50 family metallopeptidase [Alphaproteobacteria bacterium]
MLYVLAFLVVLSVVVLIHEAGHFFMARLCGVRVEEFSFGFGRELFGVTSKKSGTRYKVCVLPLGGYVKMLGNDDVASVRGKEVAEELRKYAFQHQAPWKKFLIVLAGPFMNYLFAIVALAMLFMFAGAYSVPPVIESVVEGSPAQMAGVQPKDIVRKVNGRGITDFAQLRKAIMLTHNAAVVLHVERSGQFLDIEVVPQLNDDKMPFIGVGGGSLATIQSERLAPWPAVRLALYEAYNMTHATLVYIRQILFSGRSASQMRGPLGIAEMSGDAASGGALSLLVFIVQVSIAIGLINLMPIPLMDGSHLILYVLEMIRGKPVSEKTLTIMAYLGWGIILFLLLYTFYNDIPRIWGRLWS